MALYNHNDSLICKTFPFTLEGNSMKWYAGLPSGSIMDFKTLSDKFMKAFFAYKEVKCGTYTLFLIHQINDESLRKYIKQFRTEFAEVNRPNNSMVATTFKNGLLIKFELSRKQHKPKYEYITLVECFDKAKDIVPRDKEYIKNGKSLK
ncbi:hypothetical protein FF1_019543 [Malus domestica]